MRKHLLVPYWGVSHSVMFSRFGQSLLDIAFNILNISWAYLKHILGISWAYLGICWAYIQHIFGISKAYLGHIWGIY